VVNQIDFVLVETFLELGKDGSAVTVFDSSSRTLIEKNIIQIYPTSTLIISFDAYDHNKAFVTKSTSILIL
jgi:hypothetical protein